MSARRPTALPRVLLVLLVLLGIAACQPAAPGQVVTLAGGERCTILDVTSEGRRLGCPQSGLVMAPPAPGAGPALGLSDIPGIPDLPPVPQSRAEAECRAGHYVQGQVTGRVRGAVEGAVLDAAGLPGNTLSVWRRSQEIARRIENRPAASAPPDPCADR